MGRGITETAVNNKSLHLELEYRRPSMLRERQSEEATPRTHPVKAPSCARAEIRQAVRQRTWELQELRGRTDGSDFDDWIEAESEVIRNADHE